MPFAVLDPKPGVFRDDTQYRSENSWWDADKMRFRNGRPEMIGGWRRKTNTAGSTLTMSGGAAYASVHFNPNTRLSNPLALYQILTIGTSTNFYYTVFEDTNSLQTVSAATPISPPAVTLGTDPITDSGTTTLRITEAGHKKRFLDLVTIAGATTFAGITTGELNRAFTVVSVIDANTYTIEPVSAVTYPGGSTSGGGAAVTVTLSFNSARSSASANTFPREWSQATYGQDVLFCDKDQAIYYMTTGSDINNPVFLCEMSPTYPTALGLNAYSVPVVATGIEVGKDRSAIAFGANPVDSIFQDKMLVRWSDQENVGDWEPREDNTAGDFRIPWGGYITGWIQTKREILIWTDTSLVSMKWIGAPYYYGFDKVADNVPLASMRSVVAAGDAVYWMGPNQFYVYDGSVSPIPCSMGRYVFTYAGAAMTATPSVNFGAYTFFAGHSPEFNEVWFFYSTVNVGTIRYAIYNYLEKTWTPGTMRRYGWTTATQGRPVAIGFTVASSTYDLYRHEIAYADHDGTTANNIASYIESGDMDIGEGDRFIFASRMIADHGYTGATGTVTYTFSGREDPLETLATLYTVAVTTAEGRKDVRFRQRQVVYRISTSANDFKWSGGKVRLDIQPDGMR